MRDRTIITLLIYLFCIPTVFAESFTSPTSRSDALGGTTLLSTPLPSEQILNGAPLTQNDIISLDFGYKRQYDLKELDLIYSALSYKFKNYNIVVGFSQLGDPELYTQKTIRLGILYTKSFLTIGNFVLAEIHDFNNHYESVHEYVYGFSIHIKQKTFRVSSVFDNINRPQLTTNANKSEPKLTIYVELLGVEHYKTTIKFSTQKGEKNMFGIGESLKISETASLLFGFSTAPVKFGGGIEINWKNNNFIYNSAYHPVLGLTHTISFGIKLLHH